MVLSPRGKGGKAPQPPHPVALLIMLTPPRSSQNLLGQVWGAAESSFYFTSIRMSAGQEGEVSAELAPPVLTSQHPSSAKKHGNKTQPLWGHPERVWGWEMPLQCCCSAPSCLRAVLWFHPIARSYSPDIRFPCCQHQLLPLSQSQHEATNKKKSQICLSSDELSVFSPP